MSRTINKSPSFENGQALHEMHRLYLEFVQQLSRERDQDYPYLTEFQEWVAWWRNLSPVTRSIFEQDFRMGYAATVAEGERQVAAVLTKHDQPAGGPG